MSAVFVDIGFLIALEVLDDRFPSMIASLFP